MYLKSLEKIVKVEKESLENAHKFKLWKNNLKKNGLTIHQITEHFTRYRHNGEVLFSLLMLDATSVEGDKIPPLCLLKGEVVSVLVCLIDEKTKEKYLLLVRQRRIANGDFIFEHPAGMVDGSQTPLAIAIQEVREETGIELSEKDLVNLTPDSPLFPSTGTSDEAMYFFYCEIELSYSKIMSYDDNKMGVISESERITTYVKPFAEGHRLILNSNGRLLCFMYLSAIKDYDTMKTIT